MMKIDNDKWINAKKNPPIDKKPILVLVVDEPHIAYWCDDSNRYKVGSGENCYYCGGKCAITFIDNQREQEVDYWQPLEW